MPTGDPVTCPSVGLGPGRLSADLSTFSGFDVDGALPWDHVDIGVRKSYLAAEWDRFVRDRALESLRTFGNELVEMTKYFAGTPFRVFQAEYVSALTAGR